MRQLAWRRIGASLLAVLAMSSACASAATVQLAGAARGCLIDLDGRIDRATPRLLDDAMKHAAGSDCLVRVSSHGGDLDAAIETGRLIRRQRAATFLPEQATCASACLLLFVGGVQRQALGGFALHRAYSSRS